MTATIKHLAMSLECPFTGCLIRVSTAGGGSILTAMPPDAGTLVCLSVATNWTSDGQRMSVMHDTLHPAAFTLFEDVGLVRDYLLPCSKMDDHPYSVPFHRKHGRTATKPKAIFDLYAVATFCPDPGRFLAEMAGKLDVLQATIGQW